MGLDFSHGDVSWSYSGFNQARERLAATLGLHLRAMEGFGGLKPWPSPEKYPLVHLLHHSDCDGELTVEQCKAVAPVLRAAVAQWPVEDWDRVKFLKLADAMDEAAEAGEPLEFT